MVAACENRTNHQYTLWAELSLLLFNSKRGTTELERVKEDVRLWP